MTSLTGAAGSRRFSSRGFTLAEGLIASVVLAAAVVAISSSLMASYDQSRALEMNTMAVSTTRQLMEQILSRPFDDPDGASSLGPEAGEINSSLYDNLDDFDGYSDTVKIGDNTFSRSVSVQYRTSPNSAGVASGPFAVITVQTTAPDGQVVKVAELCSDYKPAD
jgi:Tfp pilus assembly protein PilV